MSIHAIRKTSNCKIFLYRLIGLILVLASIAKGYELQTTTLMGGSFFELEWFRIVQVNFELILGLLLLVGWMRRLICKITLILFCIFLPVTAYKIVTGAPSCGCFGRLEIDPRLILCLDIFVILLMVSTEIKSCMPTVGPRPFVLEKKGILCVILATSIIFIVTLNIIFMSSRYHAIESKNESFGQTGSVVLLNPFTWPNKVFPLLPYMNNSDILHKGRWLVLLHHPDCHICEQVLPNFKRLASELKSTHADVQIAMVSLLPRALDDKENLVLIDNIHHLELTNDRAWYAQTPILILLKNGVVTEVLSGTDVIRWEWISKIY